MTITDLRHLMPSLFFAHPGNQAAIRAGGSGIVTLAHRPFMHPGPRVRVKLEPNGAGASHLSVNDGSEAVAVDGFAYQRDGEAVTVRVRRMTRIEYAAHPAWGADGPDWACESHAYRLAGRPAAPVMLMSLSKDYVLVLDQPIETLAGVTAHCHPHGERQPLSQADSARRRIARRDCF